jgi:hypothetical protein
MGMLVFRELALAFKNCERSVYTILPMARYQDEPFSTIRQRQGIVAGLDFAAVARLKPPKPKVDPVAIFDEQFSTNLIVLLCLANRQSQDAEIEHDDTLPILALIT